jgi:hypothetical protein
MDAENTGRNIAPLMPDCMADSVLLKGSRLALRGTMLPRAMHWLAMSVCWTVRAAVHNDAVAAAAAQQQQQQP